MVNNQPHVPLWSAESSGPETAEEADVVDEQFRRDHRGVESEVPVYEEAQQLPGQRRLRTRQQVYASGWASHSEWPPAHDPA